MNCKKDKNGKVCVWGPQAKALTKTGMVYGGFYTESSNNNTRSIFMDKISENDKAKIFNNQIRTPGVLPNITPESSNLAKMGYVYNSEIPNEELISETINQTDPYYTNFFYTRGGNNNHGVQY
jgi:hypothetical protein